MKNTSSRKSKVNKKSSTSSLRLALESRLLFDGALVATANDAVHESIVQKDNVHEVTRHTDFNFETLGLDKDPHEQKSAAEKPVLFNHAAYAATQSLASSDTLIIVDPRSDEGMALLAKPPVGSRLVVLDTMEDGFQQVADALGGWHEVENLHIVPWIENGEQWLGSTPLAAATTHAISNVMADWGDGLADDAHVVFHGEHIASESNLLSHVNTMTGARGSWVRDVSVEDQQLDSARRSGVDTAATHTPTSVVFIDTSVADPAAIVAATDLSAEIVYLYANQDGVSQIADYLQGRTGIDNIQIVSHGDDGELFLGNTIVNNANLAAYSSQLEQIGQSLTANGDILLYGCDVAQTWVGQQFVSSISDLTGADVAASNDATGSTTFGGDWELETRIGLINADFIKAANWEGVLAPVKISAPTGVAPKLYDKNGASLPIAYYDSTKIGMQAVWEKAGTLGTALLDVRATVVAVNTTTYTFETVGDDPSILLGTGGGSVTLKWEFFLEGTLKTANPVNTIGDIDFRMADIDGIGGNTNTREFVVPNLQGLTSYTVNDPTNIRVSVGANSIRADGTQDQNGEVTSLTGFTWKNVQSFEVTYNLAFGLGPGFGARTTNDGDGDRTFTTENTTYLLALDLDQDNSTAAGTAYQATYIENGSAISVVDSDALITQHAALGGNLGGAKLVLTNKQAGDVLSIGTLPPDISANIDTSVDGKIIVTLTGSATVTDYQTALKAITFSNSLDTINTTVRSIEVSVTNSTYGTTSNEAISTIHVLAVNDTPAGADTTKTVLVGDVYTFSASDFGFTDTDGNAFVSVKIPTLPAPADGVLKLNNVAVTANQIIPVASIPLLTFTPAGASGNNLGAFTFQVKDDGGVANGGIDLDASPNTVQFNIVPPPVAVNDNYVMPGNGAYTFNVLSNDSDPQNDPLNVIKINGTTISVASPVAIIGGTISLNADGTLTFQNAPGTIADTATFNYTISDGNGGTAIATVTLNRDSDQDGIINTIDVDNDNDGILDITEQRPGKLDLADFSGWVVGSLTGTVPMPTGGTVAINTAFSYSPGVYVPWAGFPKGTTAPELATFVGQSEFNAAFPDGLLGPTSGLTIFTGTGAASPVEHQISLDFTNTTAGVANEYTVFGISGIYPDYLTVYNAKVTITAIKADGTLETNYTGWDAVNPDAGYGGVDANGAILDTALESATATPTGFVLDPANIATYTGNQDLVPVLIKLPAGSAYKTIIITREKLGTGADTEYMTLYLGEHTLPPDSDSDGLIDALDIDSDNDGITDNVEAQTTAGYIAPSGMPSAGFIDVNQDGLDDVYDTGALGSAGGIGLTSVNTDGIDKVDYLDSDSDNDGLTDTAEAGHGVSAAAILASADTDQDGLKDVVESGSVSDGFDVNDQNLDVTDTNFNLSKATLLNADGSNAVPIVRDLEFRGINNPPVAVDDTFTTNEATSIPLNLLGNDTDLDADVLSVKSINGTDLIPNTIQTITVPHGTVTVDAAGVITFNPTANYNGPAIFDYVVQDGLGGVDTGTINITVTSVNDAPAGTDKTITTLEDTAHHFAVTDFGFADPLDAPTPNSFQSVIITTLPTSGILKLSGTSVTLGQSVTLTDIPNLSWMPDLNSNGNGLSSFTFQVIDDGGTALSGVNTDQSPNTITFNVTSVNDLPVAVNDNFTTFISTSVNIDAKANDSDIETPRADLTITKVNTTDIFVGGTSVPVTNGSVTLGLDGTLTFTPTLGYFGPIAFDYTIFDGTDTTAATVNGTVMPPPIAVDDSFTTSEDMPVTIIVVGNDSDPAGVPFGVTKVDNTPIAFGDAGVAVTGGVVTLDVDGNLVFTPNLNYHGQPTFDYTIADAYASATARVTGEVTSVNDAPVNTMPANYNAVVGTPMPITGVSIADVDAGTADVTVTLGVEKGTLTLLANVLGGLTAAQITGNGTDTIEITAPLSVINTTLAASNGLLFTPLATASGLASFAVITNDFGNTGAGGPLFDLDTALIHIDRLPIAVNDTFIIDEDTSVVIPVKNNDSDPDGDTLTVIKINNVLIPPPAPGATESTVSVTNGTVTLKSDGTLSFTPVPNYNGPISFTYTIDDGHGGLATATVTGTIIPVNDPPVAVNDVKAVVEDIPATGNVLLNDSDIDGLALNVTQFTIAGDTIIYGADATATIPNVGTLQINADGSYTFTPDLNYNGPVPVATYTITDHAGGTATATLTFGPVSPVNDAPIAQNDTGTTPEDTTLNVLVADGLLSNDSDVDSPALVITQFTIPGFGTFIAGATATITNVGTLKINADGSYTLTPVLDYNGTLPVVTYTLSDGTITTTATLALTVTPVNDAPIVDLNGAPAGTGFTPTFTENGAGVSISVPTVLVTDVDDTAMESATIVLTNPQTGDVLVVGTLPTGITASSYNPSTGTITLSGSASKADYAAAINAITFAATNDMPSTVDRLIDVTVNDGDLDSTIATTTIHVIAIDDAPVNSLPAGFEAASGSTVNLPGISLNDPDAGSANMTVTFSTKIGALGAGTLQLDITVPGGITAAQVINNGTASITITAPLAAINATLASVHGLDFNAPLALTPVSFVMSSNDNGNSGIGGPKSDFDTRTILLSPGPTAVADTGSTPESTAVSVDVLVNDLVGGLGGGTLTLTEVDGHPITIGGAPVPVANGEVTLGTDNQLTFTPLPDFNGPATFTYKIDNGQGGNATGVVLVNVIPVNDAPAGTDNTLTTLEDTAHPFTVADFGFTDPNDTPANNFESVIITTLPTSGILKLSGTSVTLGQSVTLTDIPNLSWMPDLNSNGNGLSSFTFQVVDDGGTALSGVNTDQSANTITFNDTPVNDAPVATAYAVTGLEDALSIAVNLAGTDVDGTVAIVKVTSLPTAAQGVLYKTDGSTAVTTAMDLTAAEAASLKFIPTLNFNGTVTIPFTVKDNLGLVSVASANAVIIVTAVNDAPVVDLNGLLGVASQTYMDNRAAFNAALTQNSASTLIDTNNAFSADPITSATTQTSLIRTGSIGGQAYEYVMSDINFSNAPTGHLVIGQDIISVDTLVFEAPVSQDGATGIGTWGIDTRTGSSLSRNAMLFDFTQTPGGAGIGHFGVDLHDVESSAAFGYAEYRIYKAGVLIASGTIDFGSGNDGNQESHFWGYTATSPAGFFDQVVIVVGDDNAGGGLTEQLAADRLTFGQAYAGVSGNAGFDYQTTFTENSTPVSIADTDMAITDVDNSDIVSATIVLTNAQADDLLQTGALTGGIVATSETSVAGQIKITLTGGATLSNYEASIRAITYSNSSENPSAIDRNITVTVNDGSINSNTAITTVHVVPVNDAPVAQDDTGSVDEDATLTVGAAD
uniref:Ig-like domain-containing protein n=1 Tax=Crenothrix polyspora TaxID=360316 RepID=UPI001177D3F7